MEQYGALNLKIFEITTLQIFKQTEHYDSLMRFLRHYLMQGSNHGKYTPENSKNVHTNTDV